MGRTNHFHILNIKNRCAMPLSNLWQLLLKVSSPGNILHVTSGQLLSSCQKLRDSPLNLYHYFPSPWPSILTRQYVQSTNWTSPAHVHSAPSEGRGEENAGKGYLWERELAARCGACLWPQYSRGWSRKITQVWDQHRLHYRQLELQSKT